MGVNDLWQILEPVKHPVHLHSLVGKTIAVDLSLWVCEAQSVKKMIGTVKKPHLRNLFFRISYLTLMDVKLVFVMEGEPPELKADVINKRNQIRYGPSEKTRSQKTGRSYFKSVLRECLELLDCIGIPWVQAAGEAEAMCAYLNASGYVDGCLTDDGDTFLYGAQTVYRNFAMTSKDPHVDCYTMSSIMSELGLNRDALVGLAILLGCDYLPKGVPGVGKEQALKLIHILKGQSLLQRFMQWNETSCSSNEQPVTVKKLAHCSVCSHPGSLKAHERNGCELCQTERHCEPHGNEYCCPCEWHCAEHERQLIAVENNIKKLFKSSFRTRISWCRQSGAKDLIYYYFRIVKNQIRNGVRCFQIEWEKPEHYDIEDKHGESVLQTIEEESLFEAAYPEIVAVYQKQKLEMKEKKQKSRKTKPKANSLTETDDMSFQSHVTLKPTREISSKQNSKLNLEIFPDSTLPQESISASLNSLLLSEDAPCLNTQEQFMSSSRPFTMQQIKAVSKPPISESSHPSTSSHNVSAIADLHLSTIDWEGTSFSNSPVISRNAFSHSLKSELETASSKNIPWPLCESEWGTANINKALDCDLRKTNPEEHLLSRITDLRLQDLPLKERILIKSSCPQDNVQPYADLKTLSPPAVKGSCIANRSADRPSQLSKDLLGIDLQNESRNSKVLKGDQLLQEKYKVNTSIPYSVSNMVVQTSDVRVRLPGTLDHRRKVDVQTTQKTVTKKSVCHDRYSSDEESAPVFGKAKYATQKIKQSSQKHKPAQVKKNDASKMTNPKVSIKETEQYAQAYRTAGKEETYFPDAAKGSLSFLQSHKEGDDSGTCLDSPLPLCQRLKQVPRHLK
ncbi:flap endonuclease GEN homolog 1 isoform X2 [Pteropus alecto]|uniref:flap endonuclease GEN homolog 1 isoform X2 n=1 Tax=Pteropus alecto TaxID=9402 RepID=UPI0007685EEE|nr:flap endonuclease GEN homolog 1 isoform X2 [Pteropus alecto]